MTEIPALRPDQTDWETEMWVDALVGLIVDGELAVPLLIPEEPLGQQDQL
jgi:hypothetical protein